MAAETRAIPCHFRMVYSGGTYFIWFANGLQFIYLMTAVQFRFTFFRYPLYEICLPKDRDKDIVCVVSSQSFQLYIELSQQIVGYPDIFRHFDLHTRNLSNAQARRSWCLHILLDGL